MALVKYGQWGIVDGTETIPDAPESARVKFISRRDRALAIIILSVEPSLLYLVGEDPDDPVKVWKTFQDQFQRKT